MKWDGYRTQIVKDDRGVRAYTRNGSDWSTRYWPITLTASVMPFKSGIIDGEVVVLDDQHRSNFNELQAELSGRRSNRFVFVAFDLLHLDGIDMRKLPWWCGASACSGWCRPPMAAASSSARRYPALRSKCSTSLIAPALRAWPASRPTAAMSRARGRLGSRRRRSKRRSLNWSASAAAGKPAMAMLARTRTRGVPLPSRQVRGLP